MKKLMKVLLLPVLCLLIAPVALGLSGCGGGGGGKIDDDDTPDIADTVLATGTFYLDFIYGSSGEQINTSFGISPTNWKLILDNEKNLSFFIDTNLIQSSYTVTNIHTGDTYTSCGFTINNANAVVEFFNNQMATLFSSNAFAEDNITQIVSIEESWCTLYGEGYGQSEYGSVITINFTTNGTRRLQIRWRMSDQDYTGKAFVGFYDVIHPSEGIVVITLYFGADGHGFMNYLAGSSSFNGAVISFTYEVIGLNLAIDCYEMVFQGETAPMNEPLMETTFADDTYGEFAFGNEFTAVKRQA
jgi:hypothetical protein